MRSDRCVSRADQLGSLWEKKGKNCYPLQGFQGDSIFMWIRNARADWLEWGIALGESIGQSGGSTGQSGGEPG